MFDDVAYTILEDHHANLWMGSEKGVYRVSKSYLMAFDKGTLKTIPSVSYGPSDGMKSDSVFAHSPQSGCRTRDGKLWFLTPRGPVVIDPNEIKINKHIPPVYIERLVSDKNEIDINRAADLPPGEGRLEFYYTALSFLAPEKVRFKYRLEGFDPD